MAVLEKIYQRRLEELSQQILEGQAQISFRELVNRPLPPFLWDYFNTAFNPSLGDRVQLGDACITLAPVKSEFAPAASAKESVLIPQKELRYLINKGLELRYQLLIDPANAITDLIFDLRSRKKITSHDLKPNLEAVEKLLENWCPRLAFSIKAIKPFLIIEGEKEISRAKFARILASAIEKESAIKPLIWLQLCLEDLKTLLELNLQSAEVKDLDCLEILNNILDYQKLSYWKPALLIEKEILLDKFNISSAILALERLDLYLKYGIIIQLPRDETLVKAEIDSFTGFIEQETED
jgi:hypothetical protein